MPKISALDPLMIPAPGDEIPVHDISSGTTKKISLKALTGFPEIGWTAAVETWTFDSFSATTRIGVITVPTDALLKYTLGNKVRFFQDGVIKWAFIMKIEATKLHCFFGYNSTSSPTGLQALTSSTITEPMFSPLETPFGFPDVTFWRWRFTTSANSRVDGVVAGTTYQPGGYQYALGVGKWRLRWRCPIEVIRTGPNSGYHTYGLSTANNSIQNPELCTAQYHGSNVSNIHQIVPADVEEVFTVTTPVTIHLVTRADGGAGGMSLGFRGDLGSLVMNYEPVYIK